jgi:Flp pilus assembly protein TadD
VGILRRWAWLGILCAAATWAPAQAPDVGPPVASDGRAVTDAEPVVPVEADAGAQEPPAAQAYDPPAHPGAHGAPEHESSTLLEQVTPVLFGGLCSLLWFVVIVAGVLGLGRSVFNWPWLYELAVVRAVADWVEGQWARLVSRREMERQLRLRTRNPRDSKARYNLGVIYMRQRRWQRALEELQSSLEINEERADAHLRVAQCLVELGRDAEAEAPLLACLERRPDHIDAQLLLGRCYVQAGRHAEARHVYEGFLSRHPDDAEAWYHLGLVALGEGDTRGAGERFAGTIDRARTCDRPNRRRFRRYARLARRKVGEARRAARR